MKKAIKLLSILFGVIIFASACASRTCPTYADSPQPKVVKEIERTV